MGVAGGTGGRYAFVIPGVRVQQQYACICCRRLSSRARILTRGLRRASQLPLVGWTLAETGRQPQKVGRVSGMVRCGDGEAAYPMLSFFLLPLLQVLRPAATARKGYQPPPPRVPSAACMCTATSVADRSLAGGSGGRKRIASIGRPDEALAPLDADGSSGGGAHVAGGGDAAYPPADDKAALKSK